MGQWTLQCARRVVGSAISDKPNGQLVVDALEIAL